MTNDKAIELDKIIEKAEAKYVGLSDRMSQTFLTSIGVEFENARLMPIIKGQAEVIQMLMEQLAIIKQLTVTDPAEAPELHARAATVYRLANMTEPQQMLEELAK